MLLNINVITPLCSVSASRGLGAGGSSGGDDGDSRRSVQIGSSVDKNDA